MDKKNVYDSHFNFIASEKLPFEVDVLQCLDDGGFLLGLSSWNKDLNAGDKIIKVDSALNPLKTFCEYEKGIDPNYWISFYHFLHYGDCIIYNRFLDNRVYLFSENGELLKNIYFDFGKKNVPGGALKQIEQKEEMFDRLCCLQNFTIVDENYLLGYVWDERSDKIFLIDRTKNILYLGKPDPFNKLGHVIGICAEGIISCIYPGEYLEYKEQGKDVHLPMEVVQHLNNEGTIEILKQSGCIVKNIYTTKNVMQWDSYINCGWQTINKEYVHAVALSSSSFTVDLSSLIIHQSFLYQDYFFKALK